MTMTHTLQPYMLSGAAAVLFNYLARRAGHSSVVTRYGEAFVIGDVGGIVGVGIRRRSRLSIGRIRRRISISRRISWLGLVLVLGLGLGVVLGLGLG